MPTPASVAIARTGASTPETTKTAAAASSRACSLRRASARFGVVSLVVMVKRNAAPYSASGTLLRERIVDVATEFRDHDRSHAGRLRRRAPGLAGGGRDPPDRARVAVRPPDADRRRPWRPGLRGLDAPLRAGRPDRAPARRAAGDQQPLPAAGDAGQDRRDRRRGLRWPARVRDRRRLAAGPPD